MTATDRKSGTRLWSGLLLVAVASLVGLLLVEGMLRLLDYSRPPFYRFNEALGASHRPDTEGWVEEENLVHVIINKDGLRGPEIPFAKPPGTYRIAVLGDSFAEGFQVNFDERFSAVAERALNECDPLGRPIEVLNFGVSGYGTAREILMYREMAQRYAPDLVLLLFTPVNDLRNNLRVLEASPWVPYFELVDGKLRLDDSFRSNPDFRRKLTWSNLRNDIVYRVRILQVLQDFYARSAWLRSLGETDPGESPVALGPKRSLTFDAPETPVERDAWDVTEAMLSQLHAETAAAGQGFWLSVVPPGISSTKLDSDRAPGYVEQRIAALAQREGIGFISLTAPLWRQVETSGIDVDYFEHLGGRGGHWNAAAHAVVGETLAKRLCSALRGGNISPTQGTDG